MFVNLPGRVAETVKIARHACYPARSCVTSDVQLGVTSPLLIKNATL